MFWSPLKPVVHAGQRGPVSLLSVTFMGFATKIKAPKATKTEKTQAIGGFLPLWGRSTGCEHGMKWVPTPISSWLKYPKTGAVAPARPNET